MTVDPLWADFWYTALDDSAFKLRAEIRAGADVSEAILRLARDQGVID